MQLHQVTDIGIYHFEYNIDRLLRTVQILRFVFVLYNTRRRAVCNLLPEMDFLKQYCMHHHLAWNDSHTVTDNKIISTRNKNVAFPLKKL